MKPPLLHSHRYLTGYGQETGGITCQLYNNDPENSIKVLYLETVTWFVRLYLHTLEVTNNVKLIEPGNVITEFDIWPYDPQGGYSSMIWIGTCRWDVKIRPILYQLLLKNETHFYTRAKNFKQNLLKISHYFPKLLSFQANSGNFGIILKKLGLFLHQF